MGLRFLFTPVGAAVITSMLLHREVRPAPLPLWVTATVFLVVEYAYWWLAYRVLLGCSLRDTLGALFATKALTHARAMGSLSALLTRRIPWRRTSKFKALPLGLVALASARVELLLGLGAIVSVAVSLAYLPRPGLLLMFLIGALYQSLNFLAAPALALVAERDLRLQRAALGKAPQDGMAQRASRPSFAIRSEPTE